MAESVSGQAYGGRGNAPLSAAAPFRDPRTFVPHAYAERTVGLGEISMRTTRSRGRRRALPCGSSGGLLSAWLSAFALPGQLRGAVWEDPPFFASETRPLVGHSIKLAIGPLFRLNSVYLDDQWRVSDWEGLRKAAASDPSPLLRMLPLPPEPPQNLRECDPEWGRACHVIPDTGNLLGALSDLQAAKVRELVTAAGAPIEHVSLPDAAHAMHFADPERCTRVVSDCAKQLPAG